MRFWDVAGSQQLGPPIEVTAASFAIAPDRPEVAAATVAGAQRFTLDPVELRSAACRIAVRQLTDDEADRYLGGGVGPVCG